MWFRNLSLYRLPQGWDMDVTQLEQALKPGVFVAASAMQDASLGWAPTISGDEALVHSVQRQLFFTLRSERKLLPAKVIGQFVRTRAEALERSQGFKPSGKRLRELKDEVRDELLPRAFSVASDLRLWIDPFNGWLAIDSASANRAHEALSLLVRALPKLPVRPLSTRAGPAGQMTQWLAEAQPAAGFTIDQDTVLKARDSKATIRYASVTLDAQDMAQHVRSGRQCASLALTWQDRVSFVLTETLTLRRIKPLESLRKDEGVAAEAADERERFQADMTLMTGELSRLLQDLIEALGGFDSSF
jgi:recombination associated protein RdgC